MSVLAIIQVSLLAIAKAGLAGHFTVPQFIDVIAVGFRGQEALSLAKRILVFGGRSVEGRPHDGRRLHAGE